MDDVEYAYTGGMDESTVQRRLRTAATGVLALADDGDAYAVPVAHHYDGERLYVRLGETERSKKLAWIDATDTACYLVYGTEGTDDPRGIDSWSVLVVGRLHELSDDEGENFDDAWINRRFSPIRVFDEPIDEVEVAVYALDIETVTGRTTGEG